jgi:hypothetical protein
MTLKNTTVAFALVFLSLIVSSAGAQTLLRVATPGTQSRVSIGHADVR